VTDTAETDFLDLRDQARAMFPVLAPRAMTTVTRNAGDGPSWEHFNGNIAQYNIPLGYNVAANHQAYLVAFHEPGHEFEERCSLHDPTKAHRQAFLTLIGVMGDWDVLVAASKDTPQTLDKTDPGEWWADAFADAVAGVPKVGPYQVQRTDPLRLRSFFQSLLPLNPATLPPLQKGPVIEWVGPAADPNFLTGRSGNPISLILDHWIGAGTLDQAIAHFKDSNAVVSAHYIVGTTGRIVQVVADEDTAYQAGDWTTNLLSIGIEHEATPTLVPSDALYAASAWLHRYLADKHHLTLAAGTTVKRHRDIVATACPGTLDVERIVNTANGGSTMPLDPVNDAAAFKAMFLTVYGEIGVAALFDQLKAVEASLASKQVADDVRDAAQAVHDHDIPAGKTSSPKQP
jgi:hypothetical protein